MKRVVLLFILGIALLALPGNWLMARRHASPSWPDPIAEQHRLLAVNMDLADLAALSDAALNDRLHQAWEDGAHIIRLRVPWALIQPQPDIWRWQAFQRVMAPNDYHFHFILTLDGTPVWARASADADNPYAPPRDVRDFGRFAAEAAHQTPLPIDSAGLGNVIAFQIWNEPNIGPHWGARYADPQAYFQLLREAANSIRDARPQARIMLASLAPTTTDDHFNIPDPIYLERLLNLGAGPFFDFAAGQAYGFDQPPETPPAADQLNFRRVELLHDVLARHGAGMKAVYITSWGWWTPQASGLHPQASPWRSIAVSDLHDYQQRAWERMQVHWPWAAAPAWVQYTPAPDDDPIRRGWVQRDAAGLRTPAGEGVVALAHSVAPRGAGAYAPDDRSAIHYEGWRTTHAAADPNEADVALTLSFRGRAAAIQVQRGAYKGHFQIEIDNRPAPDLPIDPATGHAYLSLYDPAQGVEIVPVARDLPDTEHRLRVRAQGGWGHWPLQAIIIDDKPHPRPWPFWPITAVLVIILSSAAGLLWRMLSHGPYAMSAISAADTQSSSHASFTLVGHLLALLAAYLPAAALVTLPFYMHPLHIGPVGLPLHELFIWLGLGAAFAYWIVGIFRLRAPDTQYPLPHTNTLDIAILLLLIIGFFAALNARYQGYAFYDWRVTLLTPAVFYWLMTRFTLRQPGGVQRLGHAALLGGVLVSLIALWQFVTGQAGMAEGVPRVQALYGSANNLALVLGRLLPLAVALVFSNQYSVISMQWGRRVAYGAALLIIAAASFLTFSKGLMFISIPVGLVALFIFQPGLRKPILILAVLGVLALIPFLNTPRLAQITSGTGRFRIYLWQSAWRMWRDHPWLGVGPDNFLYAYRSFYALPAAWEELNLSHPHNLIFDLLTRIGVLGFMAGIWLLGQVLWQGQKLLRGRIGREHPLRPWVLGLWAGLIAGLAHGMIDNSIFLPDLMILTLLAAAVVVTGMPRVTSNVTLSHRSGA